MKMYNFATKIYYKFRWIWINFKGALFGKKVNNFKNIPIIINNFNQLTYLKKLVSFLEEKGYNNIYIIDNASTYPQLLEYYSTSKHEVIYLKENIGYKALWETSLFKKFRNSYYVYTDPDVLPIEDCPDNFLEYFYNLLQKYKRAQKVGFSLKIDDLPSCFKNKGQVIKWEKNFWNKELDTNIYSAPIDTTFALYRPFAHGEANFVELNIRTGYPYQARHLPWYNNSEKLTDEQLYYISQCNKITHWTEKMKDNK